MIYEIHLSPGEMAGPGEFHLRSTCRGFQGPLATEVFLLVCSVRGQSGVPFQEAQSIHQQLDEALREIGVPSARVVQETIYFRNISDGLPAFLEARRQLDARTYHAVGQPASTFIEQPPVDPRLNIIACFTALLPYRAGAAVIWNPRLLSPCGCKPCTGTSSALAYTLGGAKHLLGGNIYGAPGQPFEEATSMFRIAGELLRQEGMTFQDVHRAWFYLRHMDRDYGEFNRARRVFYHAEGVKLPPASTGTQAASFPEEHNFSISFSAIGSSPATPRKPMTSPTLSEPRSYGSDFSRGLWILEPNRLTLHISGTASVDEKGQTAHRGDFAGQAERMVLNVATLLAGQGASFQDLVSATTYLRRPEDARQLQEVFRRNLLPEFPNALVTTAICRPDLLCEMEAVAVLPHGSVEGRPRAG
jgi:enamine deaminase RidA (YjgF/YER057c/UK114 family)